MAVPAGLFLINEEGGMEKAEEFAALPQREMGAAANWAHRYGQAAAMWARRALLHSVLSSRSYSLAPMQQPPARAAVRGQLSNVSTPGPLNDDSHMIWCWLLQPDAGTPT